MKYFKKNGDVSGKEYASKEFNAFLTKLNEYGETNKQFGWSSYHKIELTREQTLEVIKYLKTANFVKGSQHSDQYGNHQMNYYKVLQSSAKRLNHDFDFMIYKSGGHDTYTVGIGYKQIYPRSRRRKMTLEHSPSMFMW